MRKDDQQLSCYPLWNSAEASFSPCVLPYVASIPTLLIVLIAIKYLLSSKYLYRWRPKWTHPFVYEETDVTDETFLTACRQPLRKAWALFLLAVICFGAEIVQIVMLPCFGYIMLTVAWGLVSTVLAIKRPRTAPTALLVFYALALLVQYPVFSAGNMAHVVGQIAHDAVIAAAAVSIIIILSMPARDPSLPKEGISKVGETPSDNLRSPEDDLCLWHFLTVSWMSPLISVGRKRRINEDDVWLLGFEFQHRRLHEKFRQLRGSVLRRLLRANGIDIVIICSISLVQMACNFSTPLLLQQLLKVLSDEISDKRVAMIYAAIMLIMRLLFAQTQVLNLWYGRRCYERSRGEMVMMVYEKALSRKNTFGQKVSTKEGPNGTMHNGHMNGSDEQSKKNRNLCGLIPWKSKDQKEEATKETASMGKIFNLLRGDVYEVAQRFWDISEILDKPVGLLIAVVLVWDLFGPSCFLGVLTVVFAQVINGFVTRYLLQWGRTRRAVTDARLQISSQFVEALRHLRWYGWQDHWLRQVMEARQKELNVQIITNLLEVAINVVQVFTSGVFPVVALYGYTILAGHPLSIDVIFPALQLFTMLEQRLREIPPLVTTFINASIAMGRIEDFMQEPNKETRAGETSSNLSPIKLESCSFAWPGKHTPVLSDINLTIPQGLTVVCGVVGAGKSALLQALLGELDELKGVSHLPNEMVGYCAQTPWLQSMSIRDNILFSSPYNEQRYKRVLEACALVPDLANFAHGDLSFVGENGIGLSGGQKARVALARGVYSTARILFLDDPLSALDHNTAEFIVRKCLLGPLMQDRTVVLVTHRVSLVQSQADQILEVAGGKVRCVGKQDISSVRDAYEDDTQHVESEQTEDDISAAVPDKFIEEEHRADWGVQTRVYWAYIKAGKLKWWALLVIVIALYRTVAILQSWFLKEWGEAYSQFLVVLGYTELRTRASEQWVISHAPTITSHDNASMRRWPLDRNHIPSPADDVRPWLRIYLGFAAVQSLFMLIAQLLMLAIVFCAGRTMFKEVMQRVSHATFRFFDVTPVGRLMNRLTSDIGAVDRNISIQFQGIAFQVIVWISSIVVIASVTPTFLLFAVVLTASFVVIFLWFLPLSQSLRRLEMVSLSPLLSNFGELLHGLTTVRAFHAEVRFQDRVIQVVDKFQGMDHFYWSLQSWLMYRFEALSSISTFVLTALALYTNVSAGLVAFVLVAANNFVTSTHGLCRQYGQLQMDFVSVERVDELRHVDVEPEGDIDPPAYWPRFGSDIIFENVTIRYAPHLDPSLLNISTVIPGGSTAAVIGRTGSGKSTLALSLLGVLQPDQGQILIDNIDISKVNKQALRTRITFVAQDPILFPGSIRKNLDPTDDFSDQECADALERICARHGWTLDFQIEAGGRNLSQGQRQLIGLTRAALRRSPIVILDEATASIDHETSLEIQKIIREEMKESTVITIAHRLEAINDADYYVVLDKGRIEREGRVDSRDC
ncbi:ABC bile acid transporter, putative [Talaromyces stipitatus ATCC 10500]|uniref:ABC bile acid transporter, putative n=1 Tax=Talaromyces stipitatus (strain ATCC 10500 / CBS 375.48 / QM 6759 / NRRL 1006) TaxID=441959 RepID=B8MJX9_TALSN|nr:ABC bile acid transporter, putative [Talaromyces stipitatus ATCC 10500]EED14796.1 ABC bile acid transporter, putative [Talaromyces stipitatus ATCC 10500]